MVVNLILALFLGVAIGFGLFVYGAGNSEALRGVTLRNLLRSNKEGWALVQKGTKYELEPLTRDEEVQAYRIGDKNSGSYLDDTGLMHTLEGTPLGLALEGKRPMVDIETAVAAEGASQMIADGGELARDQQLSIQDMQDRLKIGEVHGQNRSVMYVNPFVDRDKSEDIVDLRNITQLLRYNTDSDTPRKAAKNAKEAERAFEKYGGVKEVGKALAYVMVGAIATYIGTTGGGGGGGGGVTLPVSAATDILLGVL